MGDPPTTPSGERPIAAFDLDHTILHMLAASHVPAEAKELSEDVVTFEVNDVEYSISVRVGTTALFEALRKKGVDIAVVTKIQAQGGDIDELLPTTATKSATTMIAIYARWF